MPAKINLNSAIFFLYFYIFCILRLFLYRGISLKFTAINSCDCPQTNIIPKSMPELYQLKPRPGAKFSKTKVDDLLQKILTQRFTDVPYVWEDCAQQSKEATAEIQQELERFGFKRYKMIVQVTIAEAAHQGMRVSSRCLWDAEVDNYAEYTLSTPAMHVNALVFGLYWE